MTNWEAVKSTLALLAFSPDASDHWQVLGIPRSEGPLPSLDMIEKRVQLGYTFASVRSNMGWTSADVGAATTFEQKLEIAKQACVKDLPRIQREKRKIQNQLVARWMEPSVELYQFLYQRAQQTGTNHRLALHLSNLQGASMEGLSQAISVKEARRLYEEILKSPESCEDLLKATLNGGSLTMWAPSDHIAMMRIATAFKKVSLRPGAIGAMHLLVPHEPFHRCETPMQILDLWFHELLGQKWKSIVSRVEFLRQPTRCVFPGNICPLHHVKSIAIFTLSTTGEITTSLTTQWRPTLNHTPGGHHIVVDCPRSDQLMVHRALMTTQLRGLLNWDGPVRSLGNKADDLRVAFTGHFDEKEVNVLDLKLYVRILRARPGLDQAIIGSQSLFIEQAAVIVDFGHPRAFIGNEEMIEEMVLVSPRMALMTTPRQADDWCQLMTEQFRSDPLSAITRIRFRDSRGGRPWARPVALPGQIKATRARARPQTASAKEQAKQQLRTTVTISSMATGRKEELQACIMDHISAVIQKSFQRSTSDSPLRSYEWKPILDELGEWRGAIEFECVWQEEVNMIYSKMQGSGIELQGTCCILEFENLFMQLAVTIPTRMEPLASTLDGTMAGAALSHHPPRAPYAQGSEG